MALPYSYNFTFPPKEKNIRFHSEEEVNQILKTGFHRFKENKEESEEYKIPSPFIGILFRTSFKVISANPLKIKITVYFQSLINISLIFTLIAALFSTFNFVEYFLFSLIIIVLFFWGNAGIFIRHLKKQFVTILRLQSFFEENLGAEEFSDEQADWLNDPNRCPACGGTIKENDLFCPECGLQLKQNRFTKDLDTTKYQQPSQNIVYHYKKNDDNQKQ